MKTIKKYINERFIANNKISATYKYKYMLYIPHDGTYNKFRHLPESKFGQIKISIVGKDKYKNMSWREAWVISIKYIDELKKPVGTEIYLLPAKYNNDITEFVSDWNNEKANPDEFKYYDIVKDKILERYVNTANHYDFNLMLCVPHKLDFKKFKEYNQKEDCAHIIGTHTHDVIWCYAYVMSSKYYDEIKNLSETDIYKLPLKYHNINDFVNDWKAYKVNPEEFEQINKEDINERFVSSKPRYIVYLPWADDWSSFAAGTFRKEFTQCGHHREILDENDPDSIWSFAIFTHYYSIETINILKERYKNNAGTHIWIDKGICKDEEEFISLWNKDKIHIMDIKKSFEEI